MFDVGASELLLIVVVAIVVIGPKDLPLALRTAGRWIGKMRRMSAHFRSGFEAMIREAELEDMEKKWREQNEAIMKAHPEAAMVDHELPGLPPAASAEAALIAASPVETPQPESEPQLPLGRS
jgi:sec-independent protein translocase protein TatB